MAFSTEELKPARAALDALRAFLEAPSGRRLLFGATPYACDLAGVIAVDGIIDDFIDTERWHGLPVLRTHQAPTDAIVVSTTLGRPHAAAQCLTKFGLRHCDYFTFHRHSGIVLPEARFWSGFGEDARAHLDRLLTTHDRMPEATSRDTLERLVKFRLSANLSHLAPFSDRQDHQYFEDFLKLAPKGEVFADVGCFDGQTSLNFIHRCPGYAGIHVFEPDPSNLSVIRERLGDHTSIQLHPVGLSDQRGTMRFSSTGSTSVITLNGELDITVDALDHFKLKALTYLKMDIEGAESAALAGARDTILRTHPRLAVCVYHRPDDLWAIPEQVLDIRDDYEIYLRHYTEGVTETVMYFLPRH